MDKERISKLVNDLIGHQIWGISIGPSGINMHLGKELDAIPHVLKQGEISLWIQCNTILYKDKVGGEKIISSLFPQDEAEIYEYRMYLENKQVADAFISEKDQSLHILVYKNIVFSAFPWTKESEKCWIIYDHRIINPPGLMVYTDGIVVAQ